MLRRCLLLVWVCVVVVVGPPRVTFALDNGLALTPPMGFNSYMADGGCCHGEEGLGDIADFFLSSGLVHSGYQFVNTDEGWEMDTRNATTDRLDWDPKAYPSGLPNFISSLHERGLKFGIYGAASAVTCGVDPGQLYHEQIDADTYAEWGVDYLKSDNCANYALDSSVRYGAMRDSLNRTGARIVLSVEPFSITPDPEQSIKVGNLWRVGEDIGRKYKSIMDRADVCDKWAPLAGPGGWNDADMIHLQNPDDDGDDDDDGPLTLGENRMYFGLWALMKSPLLLSANLMKLSDEIIEILNSTEVIAVNQDALGVQARKLAIDGEPLPWLVGLESCAAPVSGGTGTSHYHRSFSAEADGNDNRQWTVDAVDNNKEDAAAVALPRYQIRSLAAPGRCLVTTGANGTGTEVGMDAVVLLPCNSSDETQQWLFDKGLTTVTSVVNVATGRALAVSNGTLFSELYTTDALAVSGAAYGYSGLTTVEPFDQINCTSRDCQNYDPNQMFYFSPSEGLLRQSTYSASLNHHVEGDGYLLTQKIPTWRHHCLSHVLSTANFGTQSGQTEVWGGPLADGDFVVALVNRAPSKMTINASWTMFELAETELAPDATLEVRDLWKKESIGTFTGGFTAEIDTHDIGIFRLLASA